jgi:hypothetical protein
MTHIISETHGYPLRAGANKCVSLPIVAYSCHKCKQFDNVSAAKVVAHILDVHQDCLPTYIKFAEKIQLQLQISPALRTLVPHLCGQYSVGGGVTTYQGYTDDLDKLGVVVQCLEFSGWYARWVCITNYRASQMCECVPDTSYDAFADHMCTNVAMSQIRTTGGSCWDVGTNIIIAQVLLLAGLDIARFSRPEFCTLVLVADALTWTYGEVETVQDKMRTRSQTH